MNHKMAIRCLSEVKETFDSNGIKFWLDLGTLLGAVREGKIIKGDTDIDLGIFKDSIKEKGLREKLSKELEAKGFIVQFFWNNVNIYKGDTEINVQLTFLEGDKAIVKRMRSSRKLTRFLIRMHKLANVEFYGEFRRKIKSDRRHLLKLNLFRVITIIPEPIKSLIYILPQLILFSFKRIKCYHLIIDRLVFENPEPMSFYNLVVNIPRDSKEYLRMKYGVEWKEPSKKWTKKDWFMYGDWRMHCVQPILYPTDSYKRKRD